MPRIIPIRDLKNTAAVSQMCSESKEPVYITKNGYGDMVIMSMEAYEEKMQLLDAYAKLDAAEQQVEAGQTLDARSALAGIESPLWHISWLKQPLHRQTWMRSCPTLPYRWKIQPLPQPLPMKLKSATRHWNSCPIFTSSAATLGFLPRATVKLSSSITC